MIIRTPGQRLRVFISSTLKALAAEAEGRALALPAAVAEALTGQTSPAVRG